MIFRKLTKGMASNSPISQSSENFTIRALLQRQISKQQDKEKDNDIIYEPPEPEYGTVKHVMCYRQLPNDFARLGIDSIIACVRHSNDGAHCAYKTCGEDRPHYHYLIKFTEEHAQRCARAHRNMLPYEYKASVKHIQDKRHYENLIKYMQQYDIFTEEELSRIKEMEQHIKPNERKRKMDVDDLEDRDNLTMIQLEQLRLKVEKSGSAYLAQKYLDYTAKYHKEQAALHAFKEATSKLNPMSDYELEVMCYDYMKEMSAFRLCHLIDIWIERQKHPTKADKTPVFILCGETSCGKSKIAVAFANVIGKCEFPITCYTHNDILALSDWYNTGSDVLVFDDFSFTAATDPSQPSKIFNNLKQWASGVEIHFRTSHALKRSAVDSYSRRRVKAIIISVNEIKKETQELVDSMPEMRDRIEFIPFGAKYSYDPVLNSNYFKKYNDSAAVADKCLAKFGSRYFGIATQYSKQHQIGTAAESEEWSRLFDKHGHYYTTPGAIVNKYEHYPFSNGLYNHSLLIYINRNKF